MSSVLNGASEPMRSKTASTPRSTPRDCNGISNPETASAPRAPNRPTARPEIRSLRPARRTSVAASRAREAPGRPDPGRAPGDLAHAEAVLAVHEQDRAASSLDQVASALHHQLEDAHQVELAADLSAQFHRGLEAAHRALELFLAAPIRLARPRVVDRDRGPLGQHDEQLLVLDVELPAAVLLGQVEVAEDLVPNHHRDAQERVHRRMLGREPVGAGVVADPRQAKRFGLADQLTEDAVTARKRADPLPQLLVDPDRQEAGQLALLVVEDAKGRVASPGQLASRLEELAQDGLGVMRGDERATDL